MTTIGIVRVKVLPPRFKAVIETKLNDTSASDLNELHASPQTSPEAMRMLAQNGLNVTQLMAAAVDFGRRAYSRHPGHHIAE